MTDKQHNRTIEKNFCDVKLKDMASLFILTAGTLWGMIGLFSNAMSEGGFSSIEITFIRNAVAAVGLWIYLLIFQRKLIRIEIKDIWMFLGTGILSIVFFNIMIRVSKGTPMRTLKISYKTTNSCQEMV